MRYSIASIAIFDWTHTHTGLKGTRNAAMREALDAWLVKREREHGLTPPRGAAPMELLPASQRFYEAYQAIGHGRDFVRIHRIREALEWSREHFDRVLATLAAAYRVELHGGDPSRMNPAELDGSYRDPYGTLYLTVSWRGD